MKLKLKKSDDAIDLSSEIKEMGFLLTNWPWKIEKDV